MSQQCPEGDEVGFRGFCGSEGKGEVKGFSVSQSEASFGFKRAGTSPLGQVSLLCIQAFVDTALQGDKHDTGA